MGFWFGSRQPSVLVVLAIGVSLILFSLNDRKQVPGGRLRALAMTLGLWLASALVSALVGWRAQQRRLRNICIDIGRWVSRQFRSRASQKPSGLGANLRRFWVKGAPASLIYPVPKIYFALIVLGFVVLWSRDRILTASLLAPIGLTLAAAFARQYPFSDRLILFLTPSFFVAIGESSEQIRQWVSRWSKPLGVLVSVLVTSSAVYPMAKTPPVYHLEDMKPVLAFMQERRRPNDSVYAYYSAAPEVSFYAGAFGLRDNAFAVGGCHRGDSRRYFEEIDMFRGRPRLWLLITHSLYREREDILYYLDTIGLRLDSFVMKSRFPGRSGSPAEVFLYDLSDPVRLSQATSVSSPVTGPSSVNARMGVEKGHKQ